MRSTRLSLCVSVFVHLSYAKRQSANRIEWIEGSRGAFRRQDTKRNRIARIIEQQQRQQQQQQRQQRQPGKSAHLVNVRVAALREQALDPDLPPTDLDHRHIPHDERKGQPRLISPPKQMPSLPVRLFRRIQKKLGPIRPHSLDPRCLRFSLSRSVLPRARKRQRGDGKATRSNREKIPARPATFGSCRKIGPPRPPPAAQPTRTGRESFLRRISGGRQSGLT